ncbi:hypothetical protein WP50_06275 [Lactiplantibacillus plantarum]|nr:hypothetical protein WP50_06275 [Lactiplantibacillus plantarum]
MATKIGIRQLVEFVLRQGDLNEVKNSQNTALNGAKIHRQLQSSRGEDYDSEVYLKKIVTMNDTDYAILATIITAGIISYGFSLRKSIRQHHSHWYD